MPEQSKKKVNMPIKTYYPNFEFMYRIMALTALLIVAPFGFNASAQKYQPGRITLKDGSVFEGLILAKGKYDQVEFKTEPKGKVSTLQPEDVLEYSIGKKRYVSRNVNPILYAGFTLPAEPGKSPESYLITDPTNVSGHNTYLLEVLLEGKTNLYKLKSFHHYDTFFIENKEIGIQEVPLDYYIITDESSAKSTVNTSAGVLRSRNLKAVRSNHNVSVLKEFIGAHPLLFSMKTFVTNEQNLVSLISRVNGLY